MTNTLTIFRLVTTQLRWFIWSVAIIITPISACSSKSENMATDKPQSSSSQIISETRATNSNTVSLNGVLVLYGADFDAWLGLRNAQNEVTRLVFDNPALFVRYRTWQNKSVMVKGTPDTPLLNRPQLRVQSIQTAP
jgi:hypothetical protein